MNTQNVYKVVLVFHLEKGKAEEELRRSKEPQSFPSLLSQQPGFLSLELVKIDDDNTMSVQTWQSDKDWWKALETVKQLSAAAPPSARENILVKREFFGGYVQA